MNGTEAIRANLDMNFHIMKTYLSDLSDSELLIRPTDKANHIAWQLGHLITSEVGLLSKVAEVPSTELPAGFQEQHAAGNAGSTDTTGWPSKSEYLDLFDRVRANTLAGLEKLSDADLSRPNDGPMSQMAPTIGALFILAANHVMMHAAQFVIVRRQLDKPVLI